MPPAALKTTGPINPEYRAAALGKLDRRTWQARLLRDARAELTAHVGGTPSATQTALIEQLAQLRLRLVLFDRRFAERGEQTDHDRRSYLAFANTHARLLGALGLKAAPAEPAPRWVPYAARGTALAASGQPPALPASTRAERQAMALAAAATRTEPTP